MDSLVKSQLLDKTVEMSIHVSRYTVNAVGARYAPRFCYGHRVANTIDHFTPLAVANGFKETQVTYHYSMQEVPVWAKSADVLKAFPAMAEIISGQATGVATLAQTRGRLAGPRLKIFTPPGASSKSPGAPSVLRVPHSCAFFAHEWDVNPSPSHKTGCPIFATASSSLRWAFVRSTNRSRPLKLVLTAGGSPYAPFANGWVPRAPLRMHSTAILP